MAHWWHRLFNRERMEGHLEKEIRFHLDEHASDLVAQGRDPGDARRQVRLALDPEPTKEACRDARGTRWLEDLYRDCRYAIRTLRRKPGFTLTALATLTFGTGAIATVLTLANTLFLRDLPVDHPDRVVVVQATRRHGQSPGWVSYPDYVHFRDHAKTLAGLAAHYSTAPLFVTVGNQAKELNGAVVSANFFPVLGLRPALGRFFRPDEDKVPDRNRVAVLSYDLWRTWFDASPAALGALFKINGTAFTVIGVAPSEFRGVTVEPATVYIPQMMAGAGYRWCTDALAVDCGVFEMIGRLAEGRTVEQARAEMATLIPPVWAKASEGENTGVTVFHARGALHPDLTRREQIRFVEVLAAVAALLLLVCAVNLAGLFIARNGARTREFSIRAALGAGSQRLARQLVAEPLVLALIGGTLGTLVSVLLTGALNVAFYTMDVEGHPLFYNFAPEPRVIVAVVLVSMAAGLLAGIVPAWKLLRGGATAFGGRSARGLWLAAGQASAAVALLAVAGLLGSSAHLRITGINFDSAHVALMRLRPRLLKYPPEKAQRFVRKAMARLEAAPGVESASMVGNGAVVIGQDAQVSLPAWAAGQSILSGYIEIGPRYFETLRTPVLRGREFDARDTAGSPGVAVVDETLARRLWSADSAIGATVVIDGHPHQVVGVVADIPLASRGRPSEPYVYVPFWQNLREIDARVCVRVKGDPAAMLPGLTREVHAADPEVPIAETMTLPVQMAGTIRSARVTVSFVSYAAALAVLLSGIGLYGTLAFSISRRTREIGIRLAVGARPVAVLAMVVREGMTVMLGGVVLGVGVAFAGARVVRHLLYGPGSLDARIYAAAALLIVCVSLFACWIPGRRASRIDPAIALRDQ